MLGYFRGHNYAYVVLFNIIIRFYKAVYFMSYFEVSLLQELFMTNHLLSRKSILKVVQVVI